MAVEGGGVIVAVLIIFILLLLLIGGKLANNFRIRIRAQKRTNAAEKKKHQAMKRRKGPTFDDLESSPRKFRIDETSVGQVRPLDVKDMAAIDIAIQHIKTKGIPTQEIVTQPNWVPRGAGAWKVAMTPESLIPSLDRIAQETEALWNVKRGTLLDEMVENLEFKNNHHPHVIISEICRRLAASAGSQDFPHTPLQLLALLIFTQESRDIDRLLHCTVKNNTVPIWVEGSLPAKHDWDKYETTTPCPRSDIDAGCQLMLRIHSQIEGTESIPDITTSTSSYEKWIRLTTLLSVLCISEKKRLKKSDDTQHEIYFKRGYNLPSDIEDEFNSGKYICWTAPTVVSKQITPQISRGGGGRRKPTVEIRISGLNSQVILPLQHISQYPDEAPVLIAPMTVFKIESVRKDEKLGTVVDLAFIGTHFHQVGCNMKRRVFSDVTHSENQLTRMEALLSTLQITQEAPPTLYIIGAGSSIDGAYPRLSRTIRGYPVWYNQKKNVYVFTSATASRWVVGRSPESGSGRIISDGHHSGEMPHLVKRWMHSAHTEMDAAWIIDTAIKISAIPPKVNSYQQRERSSSASSAALTLEMDTAASDELDTPLLSFCQRLESPSPSITENRELYIPPPVQDAQVSVLQGEWSVCGVSDDVVAVVAGLSVEFSTELGINVCNAHLELTNSGGVMLADQLLISCKPSRVEWADGDVWIRVSPSITNLNIFCPAVQKQYRDISPPPIHRRQEPF